MNKAEAKRLARTLRGQMVGGWTIGELLNSGGSAVVFSASKGGLDAALKIIDPALEERFGADEQEERISREVTLIGRTHPNIVRIYDGGRCPTTGYLFIAMEKLELPDLGDALSAIPRAAIPSLISQLAGAARYLEAKDIVHRDIKSENIKITAADDRIVLLDMGIMRPTSPGTPSAGTGGQFIGTVRYSPPEFVWRQEDDTPEGWRAITFYQLGAVLHDMIMRKGMFSHIKGPQAAIYDAVKSEVPVVEADDVPLWLIKLARACLQKDPRLRLELVSWDSFDLPRLAGVEEARTRVRAVWEATSSPPPPAGDQSAKAISPTAVGSSLRGQLRKVQLAAGDLPNIELDYRVIGSATACVVADLHPSPRHQLLGAVRVLIRAELRDGGLIILSWAAAWGKPDPKSFNGTFEVLGSMQSLEEPVETTLLDAIYLTIDAAMSEPPGDEGSQLRTS